MVEAAHTLALRYNARVLAVKAAFDALAADIAKGTPLNKDLASYKALYVDGGDKNTVYVEKAADTLTSHGVPVRRHLGRLVLSGSLMVL